MAEKVRKSYQKPQLRRVKLEKEESVLTACKSTPSDATAKNVTFPCGNTKCSTTLGS